MNHNDKRTELLTAIMLAVLLLVTITMLCAYGQQRIKTVRSNMEQAEMIQRSK